MSRFYALVRAVYDPGGRSLAIEPRIRCHRLTAAQRAQLKDDPELLTDGVKVHVAGANDPLLRDALQAGAAAARHALVTRGYLDTHVHLMNWTFPTPVQGESAGLLSVLAFVHLCVQPACAVAATGKIAKQGDTWEGCHVECIAGINTKLQALLASTAHTTPTPIVFFYPQGHETGAGGERLDAHLRGCAEAAGIQLIGVRTVAEAVTRFLQLGGAERAAPSPPQPGEATTHPQARKWRWGVVAVLGVLGAVWLGWHTAEEWGRPRPVLRFAGGPPDSLFEPATHRVITRLSPHLSLHTVPSAGSAETLRRLCHKEADLGIVVSPVKGLPDCALRELSTVGDATFSVIAAKEVSRQHKIHTAGELLTWVKAQPREAYLPVLRLGGPPSETRWVLAALAWPQKMLDAGELQGNTLEEQWQRFDALPPVSRVVFVLSHEPMEKYVRSEYRLLPIDDQAWNPQTVPYRRTTVAPAAFGQEEVSALRVPLVLVASATVGDASGGGRLALIQCLLTPGQACPRPGVDRGVIYGLGCLVSLVLSVVAVRSWWRTTAVTGAWHKRPLQSVG